MQVINLMKEEGTTRIKDLAEGECFYIERGRVFMKTNSIKVEDPNMDADKCGVVDIKTGQLVFREENMLVTPVVAECTVFGEEKHDI